MIASVFDFAKSMCSLHLEEEEIALFSASVLLSAGTRSDFTRSTVLKLLLFMPVFMLLRFCRQVVAAGQAAGGEASAEDRVCSAARSAEKPQRRWTV